MNISEIDDENFTVKRNETRKHNLVYKSINIETIKFDEIDNLIIDIIKMFLIEISGALLRLSKGGRYYGTKN